MQILQIFNFFLTKIVFSVCVPCSLVRPRASQPFYLPADEESSMMMMMMKMMMMKIMPGSALLQIFGFHIIFCKFILCTFLFPWQYLKGCGGENKTSSDIRL